MKKIIFLLYLAFALYSLSEAQNTMPWSGNSVPAFVPMKLEEPNLGQCILVPEFKIYETKFKQQFGSKDTGMQKLFYPEGDSVLVSWGPGIVGVSFTRFDTNFSIALANFGFMVNLIYKTESGVIIDTVEWPKEFMTREFDRVLEIKKILNANDTDRRKKQKL